MYSKQEEAVGELPLISAELIDQFVAGSGSSSGAAAWQSAWIRRPRRWPGAAVKEAGCAFGAKAALPTARGAER